MQQQHIASVDFTWMMQTLGFCSKTQRKKRHVQHQNSTKESIATTSTRGVKTSLKKWICVLSNFIVYIWIRSICRMEAMFPGVEFSWTLSRFTKRKGNSSCYVHVLYKTSHRRVHVVAVQWTSKEYTRSMMQVQSYCFAHKTNCLLTLSSASWSR